MRIPVPKSTIVNGIRHRERIEATLTAIHLQGFPLEAGKEVILELLSPMKEPQVPETDHLFPIENPTFFEENNEPVLSVYANGWDGRREIPLRLIQGLALIPGNTDFSDPGCFLPGSPLSCIAANHGAKPKGGYLVLRCGGEEQGDIMLMCPHSMRHAQQIADYYFRNTCPDGSPLSLSELGAK